MKDDKEKQIQKLLDSGNQFSEERLSSDEQEDLQAYKVLYSELKRETEEGLSYAFKANLMARIKIEEKHSNDFRFYLILSGVLLLGVGIIVVLTFYFVDLSSHYFIVLSKLTGFMSIIIISIFLSQYVEKKVFE
ncbi:hypothetical protein [Pedobacter sp. WC2423]|uniref:hypothetical protein n=1 Tax=Pedobacter sp. WC2423 TaxID=3234142 RepID=UPI0034657C2D